MRSCRRHHGCVSIHPSWLFCSLSGTISRKYLCRQILTEGNNIPQGALIGGQEADGRPLYIGWLISIQYLNAYALKFPAQLARSTKTVFTSARLVITWKMVHTSVTAAKVTFQPSNITTQDFRADEPFCSRAHQEPLRGALRLRNGCEVGRRA